MLLDIGPRAQPRPKSALCRAQPEGPSLADVGHWSGLSTNRQSSVHTRCQRPQLRTSSELNMFQSNLASHNSDTLNVGQTVSDHSLRQAIAASTSTLEMQPVMCPHDRLARR
jgi:hypothetical protein